MLAYILKTFRSGVSDENDKGVAGSFKYGHALDLHKRDDTLSCKFGMNTVFDATRGVMGSTTGTTLTGIFDIFLPASDGSTYCFSRTGSVFARNGEGVFTFVHNDENGAIKGAAEWEDTNGNNYLFWATATAMARKPFPGANAAPDTGTMRWSDVTAEYKTEFFLNADWHPMKQAAGSLYIGNAENLAEQDFQGNWDPQAMSIRPGNILTCLEERDDYVIMGSEKDNLSEEGHIWSWTPIATNWVQKKKIPVQGINALIATELLLMQGGDDGELFFSDFTNTVPLNAILGGGKVSPGGVSIENDLAVFGFYGGTYPGIWSYGRRRKNRPNALNYEYRLAPTVGGSTISTIGAIAVVDGLLIASWGTTDESTSEYGVDQVSTTTRASAVYEGLEFDAGNPHSKKTFDTVKVVMLPMPAGTSVAVKFKLENDVSWKYGVSGGNATTYSQTNSVEAIFKLGTVAMTYEVGLELTPEGTNTPDVKAIVTYISNEQYEF